MCQLNYLTNRIILYLRCQNEIEIIRGRRYILDLIIGGGKYGELAFQRLRQDGGSLVVIDTDPACVVQNQWGLPLATMEALSDNQIPSSGAVFLKGGIEEAAGIIERHRPERIFPTLPVHLSAGIISEIAGFEPDPAGAGDMVCSIPEKLIAGRQAADIYCSLNCKTLCKPLCPSPVICPVTGERRDPPLWSVLRECLRGPDASRTLIIKSHQFGAGLGYIRSSDIFSAIEEIRHEERAWIGTACRCHGVLTALRNVRI